MIFFFFPSSNYLSLLHDPIFAFQVYLCILLFLILLILLFLNTFSIQLSEFKLYFSMCQVLLKIWFPWFCIQRFLVLVTFIFLQSAILSLYSLLPFMLISLRFFCWGSSQIILPSFYFCWFPLTNFLSWWPSLVFPHLISWFVCP